MQRIVIVGNSGSGKTTLAKRLSQKLVCSHVELDSLFHQPGWTAAELDNFRAAADEATRGDSWVVCGNYRGVRDVVWPRADTVIVFDLPHRTVMSRVIRRTLRRVFTRQELWNGNRETLGKVLSLHDKEKSIIAWAWHQHGEYRRQYAAEMANPANAHLQFVVVRSDDDAEALLAGT